MCDNASFSFFSIAISTAHFAISNNSVAFFLASCDCWTNDAIFCWVLSGMIGITISLNDSLGTAVKIVPEHCFFNCDCKTMVFDKISRTSGNMFKGLNWKNPVDAKQLQCSLSINPTFSKEPSTLETITSLSFKILL